MTKPEELRVAAQRYREIGKRITDPRTIDGTWRQIVALLDCFTPAEWPTTSTTQDMRQPNKITL